VNGATSISIIVLLSKDYSKWVIIAFLIACPVSYYIMHTWLQNFAYHTELSWWIFLSAGVIALLIALCTVSMRTWWAATRNPVEALRNE
jgi:putative ABC transport system permease protein